MGIDGIMETIIYLALFASAFALLGFVIGEMHGRPKRRRDKRTGRFVGKFPTAEATKRYFDAVLGTNYDPLFMENDNDHDCD